MLSLLAARRLNSSYRSGLWSEEELAPTLALLALPMWAWLAMSMFVVALLIVCFTKHSGIFIYVTTLPLVVASEIRKALIPSVPGRLVSWKSIKPLHSDHWGEAPAATTTRSPLSFRLSICHSRREPAFCSRTLMHSAPTLRSMKP